MSYIKDPLRAHGGSTVGMKTSKEEEQTSNSGLGVRHTSSLNIQDALRPYFRSKSERGFTVNQSEDLKSETHKQSMELTSPKPEAEFPPKFLQIHKQIKAVISSPASPKPPGQCFTIKRDSKSLLRSPSEILSTITNIPAKNKCVDPDEIVDTILEIDSNQFTAA